MINNVLDKYSSRLQLLDGYWQSFSNNFLKISSGYTTVALCLDATILTAKFRPIPKRPTNNIHPLGFWWFMCGVCTDCYSYRLSDTDIKIPLLINLRLHLFNIFLIYSMCKMLLADTSLGLIPSIESQFPSTPIQTEHSEGSDECIDTMMCVFFVSVYSIICRNKASISNFGVLKKIEKKQKKK
ncbi:hypothetical protein AGLY_010672 [Aphis glycines]|uniref:Uncharacterized protein n=1 Tax=Aphis glycines TaxID=307491 RepID=A0A6G0TE88_APHGL|nr:hypothetical protein AGLY_010672 [Aphis glycines]